MAKWNTFKWSDGTKWADANGQSRSYTSLIDLSAYRVSLRLTHTNAAPPGSLASLVIQNASAETGVRPQLPHYFEAFIDRVLHTQRISVRITQISGQDTTLATESVDSITTEGGDVVLIDQSNSLVIDRIHLLTNKRSRQQPTG